MVTYFFLGDGHLRFFFIYDQNILIQKNNFEALSLNKKGTKEFFACHFSRVFPRAIKQKNKLKPSFSALAPLFS